MLVEQVFRESPSSSAAHCGNTDHSIKASIATMAKEWTNTRLLDSIIHTRETDGKPVTANPVANPGTHESFMWQLSFIHDE